MVVGMPDQLTSNAAEARAELLAGRPSLLPFDPKQLLAMRVTRAQFARMCGVTKQSVSVWVRKGWINIGPDGRFDPIEATRQLMQRADPARLKARVFREAMTPLAALHARIQSLETEVVAERALRKTAISRDEMEVRRCEFIDRLEADADAYFDAHHSGRGEEFLDILSAEVLGAFNPDQVQMVREMYAADSRETLGRAQDE